MLQNLQSAEETSDVEGLGPATILGILLLGSTSTLLAWTVLSRSCELKENSTHSGSRLP